MVWHRPLRTYGRTDRGGGRSTADFCGAGGTGGKSARRPRPIKQLRSAHHRFTGRSPFPQPLAMAYAVPTALSSARAWSTFSAGMLLGTSPESARSICSAKVCGVQPIASASSIASANHAISDGSSACEVVDGATVVLGGMVVLGAGDSVVVMSNCVVVIDARVVDYASTTASSPAHADRASTETAATVAQFALLVTLALPPCPCRHTLTPYAVPPRPCYCDGTVAAQLLSSFAASYR